MHIIDPICISQPKLSISYSFEVGVSSQKGLKDVRIEKKRLLSNLLAEVVQKLPPHLHILFFSITLDSNTNTAALLEEMGGI